MGTAALIFSFFPIYTAEISTREEFDDTSIFENKSGLAEDMRFLASMPELCDITFLVGDTREPVCGVKAVLAARSKVFHKQLWQTHSLAQSSKKKDPVKNES